ncbi:MAG: hypothetical protein IT416_03865 [Candidatus Pacebacteria bacterium]|nr:hypothetical protein [Candidatus Paceibacterota bacterium]
MKTLANWIIALIHIAAWVIPAIFIFRVNKSIGFYTALVWFAWAANAVLFGGKWYPILWALYSALGFAFAIKLPKWWKLGLVLIPASAWLMITYVLTGTIFW